MITLSQLKKTYGGVTALDVPDLTIEEGQIVGLVGNNGAGKTTMMRLILDLIRANQGYATIDGQRVDLYPVWKTFTGSFLDGSFLIDFYTPEEFFDFIAEAYGIPGLRIKRPADAERVIQKALDYNDGPILIHCECEKEDNVFPMIPAGAPITSMITEQPKTQLEKPTGST